MKKILFGLAVFGISSLLYAQVISRPAQGIDFTQSIDVSNGNLKSIQAVYEDGTPDSHTLTSGAKQTGSITVVSNSSSLISAQASVTVNVRDVSGVADDSVTINGIVFTEGVHWEAVTSTPISAGNLQVVIDAHPDFVATVTGATVTVKYITYGTAGNGLPVSTSDSTNLAIGASTFSGGVNQNTITINGVVLTEGDDFNANSSSQTTANNIVTAINADSTLSTEVIASSSAAVVTITALEPGINGYYLTSSATGFFITGFTGGTDPDIDITDNYFNVETHELTTGLRVRYDTVSGTAPGGLTTGTTYYAIKISNDIYQLATSSTNAVAGTEIDITSLPTSGGSYSITPEALSIGSANFRWEGSNDNSNWTDLGLPSVNTVDLEAGGTNIWDLSPFNFKYIRLNFVGPTSGGVSLTVTGNGE